MCSQILTLYNFTVIPVVHIDMNPRKFSCDCFQNGIRHGLARQESIHFFIPNKLQHLCKTRKEASMTPCSIQFLQQHQILNRFWHVRPAAHLPTYCLLVTKMQRSGLNWTQRLKALACRQILKLSQNRSQDTITVQHNLRTLLFSELKRNQVIFFYTYKPQQKPRQKFVSIDGSAASVQKLKKSATPTQYYSEQKFRFLLFLVSLQ